MERFYYRALLPPDTMDFRTLSDRTREDFKKECYLLGNSSRSLRTVTDVSFFVNGPYLTGNIVRGVGGSAEEVVLGRGFGMEFTGGDDNPFPLNE